MGKALPKWCPYLLHFPASSGYRPIGSWYDIYLLVLGVSKLRPSNIAYSQLTPFLAKPVKKDNGGQSPAKSRKPHVFCPEFTVYAIFL